MAEFDPGPFKPSVSGVDVDALRSWHLLASLAGEKDGARREEMECALRASINELQLQKQTLSEALAQLTLITDSLPVLVSYVDKEQRYQFVSAAYERWFGVGPMVGKHMSDVLGPEAYATVKARATRALGGETVRYEGEVPYRDGARYVDATYIPHVIADGEVAGFVAFVADVTDKKQLQKLGAAAGSRADGLLRVTAAIADAVSTDEVFEAVVDRVAEAVGASSAAVWLVESDGISARLVHALGYPVAARETLEILRLDAEPSTPAQDAIRQARPIFIPSKTALMSAYPHLASLATHESYRIACLPLMTRGRVLGTLGLTIGAEGEASAEEQSFLLLVARYGSQAIERLRLLEQERVSRAEANAAARRLEVLNHASKLFVDPSLDLPARLRAIVAKIGEALASTVGLSLFEADGLLHTTVVHHPIPEAQQLLLDVGAAQSLPPGGGGITGQVSVAGQSVFVPQMDPAALRALVAPAYSDILGRFPIYGMMSAPLRATGRIIGTATASRLTPNQPYTEDDLRLLEELSERAAAAIENSRLYQDSITAQRRAEHLYGFAQAVAVADKLQTVFDAAITAIEATLEATRSAILIMDDEGVMRFRSWRDLSDRYRVAVEGPSPWPRDAKAPEPVLVPDVRTETTLAAFLPLLESEHIGAMVFIPLVLDGKLVGKFMVYYDTPHTFVFEEMETARAIANHLASVISRFTATAELEETIRSNELFAGVLAHDLRNPLGAIMTAAQLVLIQREGEARQQAETKPLGRILSSGQRMTVMIDQLLDFTRARSGGGITIEPQLVNIGDLCTQATEELELTHPQWTIRMQSAGSLHGSWDPERLLQVVSNLVANAGHHGRPGTDVIVLLNGSEKDHVSVGVHNQGCIPQALIPHLFDPFRTARERTNPTRGVGLGLFIVREIVRAHGGTVEVVSAEEVGTTFTLRLPRHSRKTTAD